MWNYLVSGKITSYFNIAVILATPKYRFFWWCFFISKSKSLKVKGVDQSNLFENQDIQKCKCTLTLQELINRMTKLTHNSKKQMKNCNFNKANILKNPFSSANKMYLELRCDSGQNHMLRKYIWRLIWANKETLKALKKLKFFMRKRLPQNVKYLIFTRYINTLRRNNN